MLQISSECAETIWRPASEVSCWFKLSRYLGSAIIDFHENWFRLMIAGFEDLIGSEREWSTNEIFLKRLSKVNRPILIFLRNLGFHFQKQEKLAYPHFQVSFIFNAKGFHYNINFK